MENTDKSIAAPEYVKQKIAEQYPYNFESDNFGFLKYSPQTTTVLRNTALYGYSLAQEEIKKAIEENEKLHKCVDMFHEIVYQYIQWVTSNTEKKPDFIKCHDALDYCNTIYPITTND